MRKKKKMHFELSPLIVWIALWIVNIQSSSKYLQILQNVTVFAQQRRRQGYSNTSGFLQKQLS